MDGIIILLIASFFTGLAAKLVDLMEDNGLKLFKLDKFVFAVIYGLLIGYVISNYNVVAPLWIGAVFALILAKKIDNLAHFIGLISSLIFVALWGLGKINILLLAIFLVAAFLDEILSDFAEGKPLLKNKLLKFKITVSKNIKRILKLRPLLEIIALIASIIIWDFSLFLAILFFDIGYLAAIKSIK